MVSLMYVLFICVAAPLTLMLFLLEKQSRILLGFVLTGLVVCLFASEVNALLLAFFSYDSYFVTTTVTPVSEEVLKALPILFYAFMVTDQREKLLSAALAVGIGFAILENAYILVNNYSSVDYLWALVRGFGAGLMHGICTAAVGFGVSFVRKRKKLFYTGTFGLLTVAVIYHALYNLLVQSAYPYVGFLLPIATYLPVVVLQLKRRTATGRASA